MLSAIALTTVALLAGVLLAGGTYARWNSSATAVPASVISSASASLSVSALAGTALPLYPGRTTYRTATVTNTSPATSAQSATIALALTLQSLTETTTSSAFSQALSVSVGVVAATANCASGFTPAWTGALGGVPATPPSLAKTLTGNGSTAVLCVAVTLPASAGATTKIAATPAFSLVIGGTVVS